jgi:hypothetical protein
LLPFLAGIGINHPPLCFFGGVIYWFASDVFATNYGLQGICSDVLEKFGRILKKDTPYFFLRRLK